HPRSSARPTVIPPRGYPDRQQTCRRPAHSADAAASPAVVASLAEAAASRAASAASPASARMVRRRILPELVFGSCSTKVTRCGALYEAPHRVTFIGQLRKTSSGQILRRKIGRAHV